MKKPIRFILGGTSPKSPRLYMWVVFAGSDEFEYIIDEDLIKYDRRNSNRSLPKAAISPYS